MTPGTFVNKPESETKDLIAVGHQLRVMGEAQAVTKLKAFKL